jgi:hypothetical protein
MLFLINSGVGIGRKLAVKVKIGVATTCYVDPLYGTKPEIIFEKKTELSWKTFWEEYGIYN